MKCPVVMIGSHGDDESPGAIALLQAKPTSWPRSRGSRGAVTMATINARRNVSQPPTTTLRRIRRPPIGPAPKADRNTAPPAPDHCARAEAETSAAPDEETPPMVEATNGHATRASTSANTVGR